MVGQQSSSYCNIFVILIIFNNLIFLLTNNFIQHNAENCFVTCLVYNNNK